MSVTGPRPWDTGDGDANWAGYFIPGTDVLRNRVGATTRDALADAENDLVEIRVAELRDDPSQVARTYDLTQSAGIAPLLISGRLRMGR